MTTDNDHKHMTVDEAIHVARHAIMGHPEKYTGAPAEFVPHDWVVAAIMTAHERGVADNRQWTETQSAETKFHGSTPVLDFHKAFDHPITCNPTSLPSIDLRRLRVRMLAEELVELSCAFGVRLRIDMGVQLDPDHPTNEVTVLENEVFKHYDPIEAADACGDLRYIVDGTNLVCGFPGEAVLTEIHRSNMSKLGADGKPVKRADGKILKGPDYFKPNIARVLGNAWAHHMTATGNLAEMANHD